MLPTLIEILDAILDGQKHGGPHGTDNFYYITTGFFLQPFDLAAIQNDLDAPDEDRPKLDGAIGRYDCVPVYPISLAPKPHAELAECHNVKYTFVKVDFLD